MQSRSESLPRGISGFTLVELLVVIGIIAVLISMLLPALSKARQQSNAVVCESNLRQCCFAMLTYADGHNGWLFPPEMGFDPTHVNPYIQDVQANDPGAGSPTDPPDSAANPPPAFHNVWTIEVFNNVWNPPIIRCPSDLNPKQQHSYVLNNWLHYWNIKYSSKILSASPSNVILMGEKQTTVGDYYMDTNDFDRVVEPTRHGISHGSNYLMLDMHVEPQLLKNSGQAASGLDPWDFYNNTPPPPTTAE